MSNVQKRNKNRNTIYLTSRQRKEIAQVKGDGMAHTAQETIPYERIWADGLMRLPGGIYSKTILFEDINYQLAGQDAQEAAFARFCDFYNYFDSSVNLQITLLSHLTNGFCEAV